MIRCSDIMGLANRKIKYLGRWFLEYLGLYFNTIIIKSIPKLGAEVKLE